jgi:DsbC/DsbD-like thiol-disulfide interchange protein
VTEALPAPFKSGPGALAQALSAALVMTCFLPTGRAEIDTRGAAIRLDLISEVRSIQPGKPFRVALRVHHEPGWHTYWRQPGIVGIPMALTWNLPEGFSAGPIQWPTPEKVKMGMLTAWGFRRDVLLLVEITPPRHLPADRVVTLRAKGAWMACSRTCHPGWGDFQLSLPVRDRSSPEWDPGHHPLFLKASEELPPGLEGWQATVRTDAEGKLRLRLHPSDPALAAPPESQWYFYAYTRHVHSDEPQPITLLPGGGIELTLSPFPIPEPATDHLEGVIECSASLGPGEPHRFFVIRAPWQTPHLSPKAP